MNKELNNDSIKKPNKTVQIIKRASLFLALLFALIVVTGICIGFFYQDEVKNYVVGELNKQLDSEIIIDGKDIDFTVLKNFPNASVDFKNVTALDAYKLKRKDTLFKAKLISLQFNILDVFRENYKIKHLELQDIKLRVRIDNQGNDNFHFWKSSKDSSNTNFSFALESISMKNIRIDYKNHQSKNFIDAIVNNSKLSGEFSQKKYLLDINADWYVNQFKIDSIVYLNQKNVVTKLELDINNIKNSYSINKGQLSIQNLFLEVLGKYIDAEKPIISLALKGKEMNIQSVLSLIPDAYKKNIEDYESDGEFYFNSTIDGEISNEIPLNIKAEFGINGADIKQKKSGVIFKNVFLKGKYNNGENSILEISSFSTDLNQGKFSGNLFLKNLVDPSFSGEIKASTSLKDLQEFFKLDTIESISGNFFADVKFSGEADALKKGMYRNIKTSGDLKISNMNLKLKNKSFDFNAINGDFKFDNNDLVINDFNGKVTNSDFQLKGFFRNMIAFAFEEKQNLIIEAKLNSKNFNLNEILTNSSEKDNASKYKLQFSDYIVADLSADIENITFRKFNATNIKGLIKLKNKKMLLDPISLSSMDGNIITSGIIDGSDSTKIVITCYSDINKINVTKMFQSFENFGQETIMDKNVKGKATAKVQLAAVMSPDLAMDMNNLYAAADMTIENGELNNVESMKSLSKYIELKDLENIKFETLKNQIEIKNQIIEIPKMEIKSSALNIYASGTHSFSNEINYKIKLSLSELLAKKAKKAKKENDEFGTIADDGLGRTNIFLLMTGTVDNPKIKYDTKGAIQNVKEDIKVEKQNLKSILKEEFGLFKKDSTVPDKYKKAEDKDDNFKIKWEGSPKESPKKSLKPPKKKEEEDF